jgi:hypothetical protein
LTFAFKNPFLYNCPHEFTSIKCGRGILRICEPMDHFINRLVSCLEAYRFVESGKERSYDYLHSPRYSEHSGNIGDNISHSPSLQRGEGTEDSSLNKKAPRGAFWFALQIGRF